MVLFVVNFLPVQYLALFILNANCLEFQVDDLIRQLKTKADSDDEIMNQVSNKVEEWKVRMFKLLPYTSSSRSFPQCCGLRNITYCSQMFVDFN